MVMIPLNYIIFIQESFSIEHSEKGYGFMRSLVLAEVEQWFEAKFRKQAKPLLVGS